VDDAENDGGWGGRACNGAAKPATWTQPRWDPSSQPCAATR